MSRWKALPESLDPRVRRLVVRMRQLKDHSGLSLTALAARTGYSRSSWDRYLSGRTVPPRQAVEALAQACDGDPIQLVALWEVAARPAAQSPPDAPEQPDRRAGSGGPEGSDGPGTPEAPDGPEGPDAPEVQEVQEVRDRPEAVPGPGGPRVPGEPGEPGEPKAAETPGAPLIPEMTYGPDGPAKPKAGGAAEGAPGPADPPRRHRSRMPLVAALAVVLIAVAAGLIVVQSGEDSAEPPPRAASPTVGTSLKTYPCHYTVYEGRQYAGHSTALTEELGLGASGEPVAEVQCMVKKHGFDPGVIDGAYGPNTAAAVRAFQKSRGLDDDGIVGPMTWRELRDRDG